MHSKAASFRKRRLLRPQQRAQTQDTISLQSTHAVKKPDRPDSTGLLPSSVSVGLRTEHTCLNYISRNWLVPIIDTKPSKAARTKEILCDFPPDPFLSVSLSLFALYHRTTTSLATKDPLALLVVATLPRQRPPASFNLIEQRRFARQGCRESRVCSPSKGPDSRSGKPLLQDLRKVAQGTLEPPIASFHAISRSFKQRRHGMSCMASRSVVHAGMRICRPEQTAGCTVTRRH